MYNSITQKAFDEIVDRHEKWFILEDVKEGRLRLDSYDLRNINFEGKMLFGAEFNNCNLRNVDFSGVDTLAFATFYDCDMYKCYLNNIFAPNSDFQSSSMPMCDITESQLHGSNFKNTNLVSANLSKSNFQKVNFSYANLFNTDLFDTELLGSLLAYVNGKEIVSIGDVGSYNGMAYYLPEEDTVIAGCWTGRLDDFLDRGYEMNKSLERRDGILIADEFFKMKRKYYLLKKK